MNLFKDFDWSLKSILKAIGAVLFAVVAMSIIFILVGLGKNALQNRDFSLNETANQSYDAGYDYNGDFGMEKSSMVGSAPMGQGIVAYDDYTPLPPTPEPPTGADLEDFEVITYYAEVQTRHFQRDCKVIADLKDRKEVIFQNSDQGKESCYFSFKVEKESAEEILELIDALGPDDFNKNIQTIKETVDYYSEELEILSKNLEETEVALQDAISAYDEVTALATSQGDAEALANAVNNKLNLIQRLNDQRLQLQNTIQRNEQSRMDQLDRLNYTFFNVNIIKDVVFDWQNIKENWQMRVREMVNYLNDAIQGVTVLLVGYAFLAIQWILYFVLGMFVLKGLWLFTKRLWKIGQRKK